MTMFWIAMRLVLIKDDNGLDEHEIGDRVEVGKTGKGEVDVEAVRVAGAKLSQICVNFLQFTPIYTQITINLSPIYLTKERLL